MHLKAFLTIGTVVIASCIPARAQEGSADVPWSTPEEASRYFLIGFDLWNAETNELVSEDWGSGSSSGGTAARLVQNAPEYFFYRDHPDSCFGFDAFSFRVKFTKPHRVGQISPDFNQPIRAEIDGDARYMSSDFKRVILNEEGDF